MSEFPLWDILSLDFIGFAMDAFESVEPYTYPLIILGIVGYVFAGVESLAVTAVGILITFSIFATTTSIFEEIPQITQFMYIIAIVGITLLLYAIVKHRRN